MSGFFSSLKKEVNIAANQISKEANSLANSASHAYNEHRTSPELELFRTGNVIQLVARSSGKAIQVVVSPSGQLVVDAMGPEGPQAYHAHWTVVDEGKNIVKLHNNNNFLAIVNGTTQILNFNSNPLAAGVECKFRLSQNSHFVIMESVKEPGKHVGMLPSGELKSALATGKETDAQFGVRLIDGQPGVGNYHTPSAPPVQGELEHRPQPPARPPQPNTQQVYVPPGSTVTVVQHGQPGAPPPYKK